MSRIYKANAHLPRIERLVVPAFTSNEHIRARITRQERVFASRAAYNRHAANFPIYFA